MSMQFLNITFLCGECSTACMCAIRRDFVLKVQVLFATNVSKEKEYVEPKERKCGEQMSRHDTVAFS